MTKTTAAIGVVACLAALYAVTALGESADCYVRLWTGTITGFLPNELLRGECAKHLLWPFSFFSS